jgi:tetratricopeptide (TPR) repeat protein
MKWQLVIWLWCLSFTVEAQRPVDRQIFAQSLLDAAFKAADSNDDIKANQLLDSVIAFDPSLTDAYLLIAGLAEKHNEWEEAYRQYLSFISLNTQVREAWYGLGMAAFELGKYEESIEAFSKALETPIGETRAVYYQVDESGTVAGMSTQTHQVANILFYLASAHRQLANYDQAIRWYEKAISQDTTFIQPRIHLAETYVEIAEVEMAVAVLRETLSVCPDHTLASVRLISLTKSDDELEQLDRMIGEDSSFVLAWAERAAYHMNNDDLMAALTD